MALRRSKKRRVKSDPARVPRAEVQKVDKGGRPMWVLTLEQEEEMVKLAGMNTSIKEIGTWFGVNEKTIRRCIRRTAGLFERIDIARQRSAVSFRAMMWSLAKQGNPKAIGLLGAKMGWYPKQRVEHTGEVGVKVLTAVAADEMRSKVLGVGQKGDRPKLRLVSSGE